MGIVPIGHIYIRQWIREHQKVLEAIASTAKQGGKADSPEAIAVELLDLGLDVMLGVMEDDSVREREREAQARHG